MFGVLLDRLASGRAERGVVLTGLRGVGKTVLLEELRSIADRRGWVAAFIEADTGRPFRLLASQALTASLRATSLRHRSSARLRGALRAFKSFSLQASPDGSLSMAIDVDPAAGRADSGDLELDLSDLLVDLGEAADDFGGGVLLLVDEMQELPRSDIAALAGAAHRVNRLLLPVAVCAAGLPNLPTLLTETKTYAERLFAYHRIGALSATAAADALRRPAESLDVTWQPEALDHTVAAADGYPYFLQVFGKTVWNTAPGSDTITVDDARIGVELAQGDLRDGFYGPRWNRATAAQQAYLAAMAAEAGPDGPVPTGQVASRLGRSHRALSTTRDQLIRRGLVYAPERGLVAFTIPGMGEFVRGIGG